MLSSVAVIRLTTERNRLPLHPKGWKIRSFAHGGAQERKRTCRNRKCTGIVGYGVAAERAARTMAERTAKEIEVRDYLINRILTEIPNCRLNGDPVKRLPNNCNISFEFIEGESLLIMLDMKGIWCIQRFCMYFRSLIRPMYCWPSDCRTRARFLTSDFGRGDHKRGR